MTAKENTCNNTVSVWGLAVEASIGRKVRCGCCGWTESSTPKECPTGECMRLHQARNDIKDGAEGCKGHKDFSLRSE